MSTKTTGQILKEVQEIENEFKERLKNYIDENKGISISMNINTKKSFTDIDDDKQLLNWVKVDIISDIKIDSKQTV